MGLLKLHIIRAELHHKVGGPLHKMSPIVHIHVGHQNYATAPCHHGGKEPRWTLQFMEIATNMF